jgi:endonuclease YncB( thermonuclease family)
MRLFLAILAILFLPELRAGDGAGASAWGLLAPGVSSLTLPAAQARSSRTAWPGPFEVRALSVKDGDTLDVEFVDGPCARAPCPGQHLAIRVRGIDAPEAHRCGKGIWQRSRGMSCAACPQEHALGRQAKEFTTGWIRDAPLRVAGVRPDKYGGRVVADVQAFRDGRWRDLAEDLLAAGLAVPYDGGRKSKPWCTRGRP